MSSETEKIITLVFDVILLQGFGGTEVCGASHVTDFYDLKFGRTGAPIYGVSVRLVDWTDGGYLATDKPNPRGEIVVNGDLVTSGYYAMEKETAEAFRYENGQKWYYTGDIGEVRQIFVFFKNFSSIYIEIKKSIIDMK
jgi:long-chain acyl-CoA synthetase